MGVKSRLGIISWHSLPPSLSREKPRRLRNHPWMPPPSCSLIPEQRLLTERFPGESKKGKSSGGINCSEISDLGERDTNRIPTTDVTELLTRMRTSEGEDDGIACGKCFCTRHRQDGVADSTSLNLRYPLFAGGVTVHLRLRTMIGG